MNHSEFELLYQLMTEYYHCTFRFSGRRSRDITEKRAMFAVVARQFGARYWEIARYFGLESHSTVIHSVKVAKGYIDVYPAFKKQFNDIVEEFEFRKTVGVLAQ